MSISTWHQSTWGGEESSWTKVIYNMAKLGAIPLEIRLISGELYKSAKSNFDRSAIYDFMSNGQ